MIHVEVNRAVMGTTDKQLPSRHRRELKTDLYDYHEAKGFTPLSHSLLWRSSSSLKI